MHIHLVHLSHTSCMPFSYILHAFLMHLTCLSHTSYMPFSYILYAFLIHLTCLSHASCISLSIQYSWLIFYSFSLRYLSYICHLTQILTIRLIFCSFSQRHKLIFCPSSHKIQSLYINSAYYSQRSILFWIKNCSYSVCIDYSAYIIQSNVNSFSLMFYCFKSGSACKQLLT